MLGWDPSGPKESNCHCITLQKHHDNVSVAGCVMGHANIQDIYQNNSGGVGGTNSIFNVEKVSRATLLRKANYNTVNNGIPTSESIGSQSLRTSYLYSQKPEWFGNRPWPWVDPQNFAQSNDPSSFPAGYRAINGEDPPNNQTRPKAPTNLRAKL